MNKRNQHKKPPTKGQPNKAMAAPACVPVVESVTQTASPATPWTDVQTWQFEPLDTWFFRESRPLESVGGSQLTSQFPPPVRTLVGAVRTTLGDALHVNWHDYQRRDDHPLRALIGSPSDLHPLSVQGPYLMKEGQRLYPAPLVVMGAGDSATLTRLVPSDKPVWCDLGRVRLPQAAQRVKPLEECWLNEAGLQAVLAGGLPQAEDLHKAEKFTCNEPRLGIALDHDARRPLDGLLYQTRHVRLAEGVSVGITVRGLDAIHTAHEPKLGSQGVARLGGEGRLAAWRRSGELRLPSVDLKAKGLRLMLALLTPARFLQGWLPDGFEPTQTSEGTTVWRGTLAERPATLVCAITGKPVRHGGWDMATQQPRDLHGLVPAGSCYFLEFDTPDDATTVAQQCHGGQIGQDTVWGYGHIAIGVW